MNIPELHRDRDLLRQQLRRAAIDNLDGPVALDLADLVARLDQSTNAQYSAVIRHRLALRGLLTVWPHRDQVAAALGLELPELERLTTLALLADPARADGIEGELTRRLPATLLTDDALAPEDRRIPRDQREQLQARG